MSTGTTELYDADVLASIVDMAAEVAREAGTTTAGKGFAAVCPKAEAGQVLFSVVFGWTPTLIPDMPVTVYKDEDWHEDVRGFIPAANLDATIFYHWPKEETEQFFASVLGLRNRMLLHGPTGTGKSTLPLMVCSKLRIPFIRVPCFEDMRPATYIGKDTVRINEAGQAQVEHEVPNFLLSCMHGGMVVIDEIFRAPAGTNMTIQSVLERNGALLLQDATGIKGSDRVVRPPQTHWIVATDNTNGTGDTTGSYVAQVQDVSTLDRFTSSLLIEYLRPSHETSVIARAVPELPADWITDMVSIANRVRTAFSEGTVLQTLSPRALISWAEHARLMGSLSASFRVAWFNKLGGDDQAVVREIYHQVSSEEV